MNKTISRCLTETERGIYCNMRGEQPPDDACDEYWFGHIMWSLWLLGVPGEFKA